VLIGCAQAIEHYEIARYGMLKAWARKLGLSDAETLLDETLQEEKRADALLSQIAEQDDTEATEKKPALSKSTAA
jgi:ferritin-like metal-binding protein YciE